MKEIRAVISSVVVSLAMAPVLYLMYLSNLPRKGSTAMDDMVIAGSILLFLGLASGYLASPTLRRSLVWLPGLLTILGLTGGWAVFITYTSGPRLECIFLVFRNLTDESAALRHGWMATAIALPVIGSIVGGFYRHRTAGPKSSTQYPD